MKVWSWLVRALERAVRARLQGPPDAPRATPPVPPRRPVRLTPAPVMRTTPSGPEPAGDTPLPVLDDRYARHPDIASDPGDPPWPRLNGWWMTAVVAALYGTVVAGHVLRSLGTPPTFSVAHDTGGDAARGKALFHAYGCTSCHVSDPLSARRGEAGPDLSGFANRVLIAGQLPNNGPSLLAFLTDPQAQVPGTAMPDLNVTPAHARDLSAYLYTLGDKPK